MNINWQSIGWRVTRKLLYYALLIIASLVMFKLALVLMNVASTLVFFAGVLVMALTVGLGFTVIVREISQLFKSVD